MKVLESIRAVFAGWIAARPYTLVFALLTLFYFGYLAGVRMEASVFADGAGRWLQIQGLLAQNFSTFACHYDSEFDPEYSWLPGPWYFYYMVDGVCFYFYQYPFALLAAPAVALFPDYGYIVLNFFFLALYIFATMRTAREIYANPFFEFTAGLLAFLIIPSPTFAYDLSEVMLYLAMLAAGLFYVVRGLGWRIGTAPDSPNDSIPEVRAQNYAQSGSLTRPAHPRALFAGGLLIALAFALRTEAAIFLAAIAGAIGLLFLLARPADDAGDNADRQAPGVVARIRGGLEAVAPFIAGAIPGLLLVCIFHYAVFGNIAGNRGTAHAAQVLTEFSFAGQLEIARLLLFGGSLGLFSALPSIALVFLWALFPGARRAAGPAGALFVVSGFAYILVVLVIAPNDGGYSWSPRYLACVFAPLYLCTLAIFWRWAPLQRWYIFVLLGALAIYSLEFTHRGMKILQQTSKQNLAYSQAIESFALDVVVFDAAPAVGFLSEEILSNKRLYMATEEDTARALVARLAATGVSEFLYLRTPLGGPALQLEMPAGDGGLYRSVQNKNAGGMQIHRMRLLNNGRK